MTTRNLIGLDIWNGHVNVWVNTTLTDGKPYDSASGEPLYEEALRPLIERLYNLVASGIVSRFIVVANQVIVYTNRHWSGIDIPLTRAVAEFLGWGTYTSEPYCDRSGNIGSSPKVA